jgi:hypothetical protein
VTWLTQPGFFNRGFSSLRSLWAKAGARFASYGSASHPAIINGKDSRKAGAVLASNQNIENNPMQSSRWSLAWML